MARPLADGEKLCPKHDRIYTSVEQCAECRAERSAAPRATSPKADTTPLRVKAAEYRLREAGCWEQFSVQLAKEGHLAVKMSDQAGKWAGRADELEFKLLEIEHDQWLIEQDQRRRGGS